jgi:hypothetical protein
MREPWQRAAKPKTSTEAQKISRKDAKAQRISRMQMALSTRTSGYVKILNERASWWLVLRFFSPITEPKLRKSKTPSPAWS